MLIFSKKDANAKEPARAHSDDAGYDICSLNDYDIPAGAAVSVHTGISAVIPSGYYLRVAPRSGLAVKHGIDVLAGVIDRGYTGEIIVRLINTGTGEITVKDTYKIMAGDKIAQLIPTKILELSEENTESRGNGGFGSTGK